MSKQKVSILLISLTLFLSSCSLSRRTTRTGTSIHPGTEEMDFVSGCEANNLSDADFVISRIKIDYKSKRESRSLSGFLKYKKNGDILLSLRSIAGIEVARALFSNDSIKLYDKINYILYVQDVSYLENKYGIPGEAIAFIWGDMPELFDSELSFKEAGEKMFVEEYKGDVKYNLEFSTIYPKLSRAVITHKDGREILIEHKGYNNESGLVYPERTSLSDGTGNMEVEISYSGVKKERIKNMRFSTLNKKETRILR